jgi:hypothetical protein
MSHRLVCKSRACTPNTAAGFRVIARIIVALVGAAMIGGNINGNVVG